MNKDIEFEGRVLNIDPKEVRQKLLDLGARQVGVYDFRRYVFDTIPKVKDRWVRLRDNGIKTTLTVKEINSQNIDGTNEWEVEVSDIDTALKILEKIGIKPKGYQENKREEYELGETELSIDFWPLINPLLEIEGGDEKTVLAVGEKLGFSSDEIVADDIMRIYANQGIDLDNTPVLKFEDK